MISNNHMLLPSSGAATEITKISVLSNKIKFKYQKHVREATTDTTEIRKIRSVEEVHEVFRVTQIASPSLYKIRKL